MRKEGRYTLKKQIGGRGFYVDIQVVAQAVPVKQSSVQWDDSCVYWRSSILFAFDYYMEYYQRAGGRGLQVEITSIHSMVVDTTAIVVVHGVIKALEQAVGYEIGSPVLDGAGRVVFLK